MKMVRIKCDSTLTSGEDEVEDAGPCMVATPGNSAPPALEALSPPLADDSPKVND